MDVAFDQNLIGNYHSKSQIIRVLTESWVLNHIYYPRCGYHKILHFPNNSAVADFYCPMCKNEYELKSKNGAIGHKIACNSLNESTIGSTCDLMTYSAIFAR